MLYRNSLVALAAVAILAYASPGFAQNYEFNLEDSAVRREAVEIVAPSYPRSGIRPGQEGWVRVNFIVTSEGRATDPVVLDSVGGAEFERAVFEAMQEWQFESADAAHFNNTMNIRFEIRRGRDLATSNFMRRYRRILRHLYEEENLEARTSVDQAAKVGGWNLYESTMLWLMLGRVEGAEGNNAGKLEAYRRALGVSNNNSLKSKDRRELLRKIFELEMEFSQYAAAARTLSALKTVKGGEAEAGRLAELVARLEQSLAGSDAIMALGTIYNASGSDEATPVWVYSPARPAFSFAALNGNVERFEVRCEHNRLQGLVEADKTWALPEPAGNCRVFVFGNDGASFQFVEHAAKDDSDVTGQAAVARSDVLD